MKVTLLIDEKTFKKLQLSSVSILVISLKNDTGCDPVLFFVDVLLVVWYLPL